MDYQNDKVMENSGVLFLSFKLQLISLLYYVYYYHESDEFSGYKHSSIHDKEFQRTFNKRQHFVLGLISDCHLSSFNCHSIYDF